MSDLWDSAVRVIWDPDGVRLVLVPYGAPMWDPVKVEGSQQVQKAGAIRRGGVKNYPRRNEEHHVGFALARVKDSVSAALQANFADTLGLPRTMKDVLLSFPGGRQFRVKNCAVQSWQHEHEDHVCKQVVKIQGGEIVSDPGEYDEGNTWGEVPDESLMTEAGALLMTEGRELLVEEGYEDE
jgi:hypothetical protein